MKNHSLWLVAVVGLVACGSEVPAVDDSAEQHAVFIDPPAFDRVGAPLMPRRLLTHTNELAHTNRDYEERLQAPPALPSAVAAPPHAAPPPPPAACVSSDLVGLSGAALTTYLKTTSYSCLYYLWTFDANVQAALSNANVTTVANAIASVSPSYNGTDASGVRELIFFVRIAYYWGTYQSLGLTAATLTAATTGLDAFAANAHFNDFTSEAGTILNDWINATDAALLGAHFLPKWKTILTAFVAGREADYNQQLNAYSIEYAIGRECYFASFKAVVDASLITVLKNVALDMALYAPGRTYVLDDAIYDLGQIMNYVPAQKSAAVLAVTNIMAAYPNLSEPYLWCVNELTLYNGCANSNGVVLCMSTLVPQVLANVVPHQYSFDDSGIQVQTGVDLPTMQTLYHATRQVQSQYSRLQEDLLPVAMDPNGYLKIIVYGTKSDYEVYQPLLFGLSVANGGIYIEQNDTFYSYQRTPAESIYTLEELFRHEYTHYLAERYAAPGYWGQSVLYNNSRMVWFDEGLAEFLAWSAPTAVYPRQTLVQLTQQDGAARMTVAQIVHATTGDFKFYHYAGLYFYYLYQHDRGKILTLFTAVRATDTATFDSVVAAMAADTTLNTNYQAFLDAEIAQMATLTNPSTTLPPLASLSTNNVATVQSAFQSALGGSPTCSVSALNLDGRFVCRGEITGPVGATADYAAAGGYFDQRVNGLVTTLSGNALNNLGYVTCRFGTITFQTSGAWFYPMSTYYCDGPLGAGGAGYAAPVAQAQSDFRTTRFGYAATCAAGGASTATCTLQLTTPLEANSVPNAALTAELTQNLVVVEEQVYGGRPTFYRNISCAFTATPQIIPYNGQKFASVPASCTIPY